jgi:hypothetical protein
MRSVVKRGLLVLPVLVATSGTARAECTPIEDGRLRCVIESVADCDGIEDYPYARNLYCPAAFAAVQEMVAEVSKSLGTAGPSSGFFAYYQKIADSGAAPGEESQTTAACLETDAPWDSSVVEGAGAPLCRLVAYATSVGPAAADDGSGNPVPQPLRGFPGYFRKLFAPGADFPLTGFRAGSAFDPVVESLGAAGHARFVADYPGFSPDGLYAPDGWSADAGYHGISGGGGGGWGGEIAVLSRRGAPLTLLAFGGGGGGGMSSFRETSGGIATSLGAGGGGGMQFGNAFHVRGRHYGGLGLGAGTGSGETSVQYSYNDYNGSRRPARPAGEYDQELVELYEKQLANLGTQLRARYGRGKTVVVIGGGGMGGGTEYFMANGEEYEPHALSTQAGFQYGYEFRPSSSGNAADPANGLAALHSEQQDFYELLGDDFRIANDRALEECGRDYSNYSCICPRAHAHVICLAGQQLGSSDEIPGWLLEQHCPDEPSLRPRDGYSSYQRLLLQNAGAPGSDCARVLRGYFNRVNTPVAVPEDLPARVNAKGA